MSMVSVWPDYIYSLLSSIPQSEETRAELSQIAWVPRQVRQHVLVTQDFALT